MQDRQNISINLEDIEQCKDFEKVVDILFIKENLTLSFNRSLKHGSFPSVPMLEQQDSVIRTYIEDNYPTILIKDAAQRNAITDVVLLERIIKFRGSSIGSPISAKKIGDTIISSDRKISVNTVDAYLQAILDSHIFYKVDLGLWNNLLANSESDIGHQIENIVYLELIRREYP